MPRNPYQIQIQINVRPRSDAEARRIGRVLRGAARAALADQSAPAGALTVRVVGDGEIRRLNRVFLGHDYATDVLSFPAAEDDTAVRYYGDLVLALPRARAQARAGDHALDDELRLLSVHGVLHLLGFDHDTTTAQRRMWRAQARILSGLGSAFVAPKPVHAKPQ